MTPYEHASDEVFKFRFGELVSDVKDIAGWRRVVDKEMVRRDNRLDNLDKDVKALHIMHQELVDHLDRVNATLNKLLLGVTGSAVTIALSVLISTGRVF